MKRYEIEYCSLADHEMKEHSLGAYVKYSDVEGLINGAKMLRELMTNHENEFRIEAKGLATTMLAGEMIESFREALKKAGVEC